jgi:hypothetical protein
VNGATTNATPTVGIDGAASGNGTTGSDDTTASPSLSAQATTNSATVNGVDSMGALAAVLCVLAFFA